ncbi:hypothetical protein [Oceanobacillus arenosus]|uniref:hypothetical protein n=1 Tax=Oceanobacillus arenosus TaxID=1229153 RepID=UPI001474A71D|nr:hypothetical protein [Oceanobacillus arenosus]
MRILLTAIWTFIVLYAMELLEVTKDIYHLSIALLIAFGGAMLIFYLFKVKEQKKEIKR